MSDHDEREVEDREGWIAYDYAMALPFGTGTVMFTAEDADGALCLLHADFTPDPITAHFLSRDSERYARALVKWTVSAHRHAAEAGFVA